MAVLLTDLGREYERRRRFPPLRLLGRLTPTRAVLVGSDGTITGWGDWSAVSGHSTSSPGRVDGQQAVAGLPGPVAVPCRWLEDEGQIHLDPTLADLAQVDGRFPVSVVVDDYIAPGPAAKQGTLLRGNGCITAPGIIAIKTERFVAWDCTETTSETANEPT